MIGFEVADWPAPANVRALQTYRHGGVSVPPFDSLNLADHVEDQPVAVAENRRRLVDELGLPAAPRWLRQVHGTRVLKLAADAPAVPPEADGAWTDRADVVCAILTADCLPVLFCSDDGAVVAATHAGWRGLLDGVLESAVAATGVPPPRLLAWFGAAIGPDHFEVGPELRQAFVLQRAESAGHFRPGIGDRWQCDLYGLARQRLLALGVGSISGGGHCTHAEGGHYYSFRRSPRCGRMASLIWRTAGPTN